MMTKRTEALAERLEQGVRQLTDFARSLTNEQWQTRLPGDGRKVGVVVHHVATVYPLEIQLAQTIAGGDPVTGVTMADVHAMNAAHARQNELIDRETAVEALLRNSSAAAAAVRALTDEQLDRTAPVSLYSGAPLTCQFVLEDHAVRHSYHHLAAIERALNPRG